MSNVCLKDMIGQRLAFDNEDDVADVRQRMPSAPPAFRINSGDLC